MSRWRCCHTGRLPQSPLGERKIGSQHDAGWIGKGKQPSDGFGRGRHPRIKVERTVIGQHESGPRPSMSGEWVSDIRCTA